MTNRLTASLVLNSVIQSWRSPGRMQTTGLIVTFSGRCLLGSSKTRRSTGEAHVLSRWSQKMVHRLVSPVCTWTMTVQNAIYFIWKQIIKVYRHLATRIHRERNRESESGALLPSVMYRHKPMIIVILLSSWFFRCTMSDALIPKHSIAIYSTNSKHECLDTDTFYSDIQHKFETRMSWYRIIL